jgi:hypothetical protein
LKRKAGKNGGEVTRFPLLPIFVFDRLSEMAAQQNHILVFYVQRAVEKPA